MTEDKFENFLQRTARDYNSPPPTPRDAMWARIEAERRDRGASAASHEARAHRWLMLGAAIAAMLFVGIAIGYLWRGTMDSRLVAVSPGNTPDSIHRELAGIGSESTSAPTQRDGSRGDSEESAGTKGSVGPRERSSVAPETRFALVPPASEGSSRGAPGSSGMQSASEQTPGYPGATAAARRENAAYAALTAEHLGRVEVLLTTYRAESERGSVDPQITSWAGDLLGTTRLLLDSPGASDPRLRKLLGDLEIVLTQITQLDAEKGSRKDELQLIDQSLRSHDVMTRIRGATPAGAGALPIGT
jgi:hypothetical protein